MREIKFRVYDNGIMKQFLRIPFFIDCEGNIYKDNDPYGVDMSGKRSIIPLKNCVIMQYTGLKDKNGVDIYEGDLLDENGYLFEVIWDKQWAKFKLQWRTKAIQFPEWNRGVQMSIIGNIYQNQDLINP